MFPKTSPGCTHTYECLITHSSHWSNLLHRHPYSSQWCWIWLWYQNYNASIISDWLL